LALFRKGPFAQPYGPAHVPELLGRNAVRRGRSKFRFLFSQAALLAGKSGTPLAFRHCRGRFLPVFAFDHAHDVLLKVDINKYT
jgi:hypothetical protein